MLQVVLGLDAKAIASAFLTSPDAMAQAPRAREAEDPRGRHSVSHSGTRGTAGALDAVLDAIYAAFAEGWTDPAGTDAARRDLAEEALFLARLAAELLPDEAEALGLLALVLYAESRRARAARCVAAISCRSTQQDPLAWDVAMIDEAEALLRRACALGAIGRYQLEAALQSAHVARRRSGRANWPAVVELYDALFALTRLAGRRDQSRARDRRDCTAPTPRIAAMPDAATDARLGRYQPYWAARAELLARSGAQRTKRTRRTSSRSASSATMRSAVSCNSGKLSSRQGTDARTFE